MCWFNALTRSAFKPHKNINRDIIMPFRRTIIEAIQVRIYKIHTSSLYTVRWMNKWANEWDCLRDQERIQRDSKSDVCYSGSWIWFASTLGACLADFTVFGIIRLHRAGTQIETEEYFPSQRRGKQTLHRKHSADAVQIQHRCTAHTVRLTDTQTEGQMNEQTGRKKRNNKTMRIQTWL